MVHTRLPPDVPCVMGKGAAPFLTAPRFPGRGDPHAGPGPDVRRGIPLLMLVSQLEK